MQSYCHLPQGPLRHPPEGVEKWGDVGPLFDLDREEALDADRVGDPGSKSPDAAPKLPPLGSVTMETAGRNGEFPCHTRAGCHAV